MDKKFISSKIKKSITTQKKLNKFTNKIILAKRMIVNTLLSKKKIYTCGNGGSAADAQHIATEFLVRLRPGINRKAYPVIFLGLDSSFITACSNDYSFDNIFTRSLGAFANEGDLLIAFTTSGDSKNILNVIKEARKRKISIISFLGKKGGLCKGLSDLEFIIPSNDTARIQEAHLFLGHVLFEMAENDLLKLDR